MKTFVIAEAGVNHNGDDDLALELVDIAAEAGADAIKFQSFSAEKLVTKDASKADYQRIADGDGSQFSMLKRLELTEELHKKLIIRCESKGVEFMSTPFDIDAANFLVEHGMKRIKIPSGEITNFPFIRHLALFDLPIILSTGMANLDEVVAATNVISSVREEKQFQRQLGDVLTVLHCTSNYPASLRNINLRAMQTIAETLGVPVGYSDHTNGILVSTSAVALGATVVEKHFTLDRNLTGPDHAASLEPAELKQMIRQIRQVETALGSPVKAPNASEEKMRIVARRGIKMLQDLEMGDRITEADIDILRPAVGITAEFYYEIVGRTVSRAVKSGSPLEWEDLDDQEI
jgi:N,N'-diacetyllegionaminate synthase